MSDKGAFDSLPSRAAPLDYLATKRREREQCRVVGLPHPDEAFFVEIDRLRTEAGHLAVRLKASRDEVEPLRTALDMVAEERDAWKARALGLPQEPCRHGDG